MNIDKVYVCAVYVKTIEEPKGYEYVGNKLMKKIINKGKFVKHAAVYYNSNYNNPEFIDITTGEVYTETNVIGASEGQMYVDIAIGLYPISNILRKMYVENKQNLSKRRIKKESR